jgi:hypothetical protein
MERHARLKDGTICEPLCGSTTRGLTEDAPKELDPPKTPRAEAEKSRPRVWPDGEYREFSEDGCYVAPYFS